MEAEVLEFELDPGSYVFYTRAAWVDGTFALLDALDESLLGDLYVHEVEHQCVPLYAYQDEDAEPLTFDVPVLDVWYEGHADVDSDVTVLIGDDVVLEHRAFVESWGAALDSETAYEPANLHGGVVSVNSEGLFESGQVTLVVIKLPAEPVDDEE